VGSTALGAVVVGTGFGCFTHVRALRAAGFEVLAVVGRDPAKTAARAAAFDVPRALTSYADALALAGVDAVTIATPPHTHAELVLGAIAAGKHVICEKPFARDVVEARAVLDAAERAGIVHVLGTEFRYDTGQALLARAVRDGLVGTPRLATFLLHVPVLASPGATLPEWWASAAEGGGWLGAHGSQVIDQVRATLGEVDAARGTLLRVADRERADADDGFVVELRLRTGASALLQSTAADWGAPVIVSRVVGSTGTAWIEALGDVVYVADRDGTRRLDVPDELRTPPPVALPAGVLGTDYERMHGHGFDLGPYTRLAEVFRDRILGRAPPTGTPAPATFADGVADTAVLDAVRRSLADGGWIAVDRGPQSLASRG
jgi:predicted dehydrogenase